MSGRPRICFLVRSLGRGGAERQALLLADRLAGRGWDVHVLSFYDLPPAGPVPAPGPAVSVAALGKKGRWDTLGFLFKLVRAINRVRPHILHPYLPLPNAVAALVRPWLDAGRLVWGVRATRPPWRDYDWGYGAVYGLERLLSGFPDLIIANSVEAGRSLRRRAFRTRKIDVIENGIDTAAFRRDAEGREQVRRDWGILPGQRLIGLVGRIDPMKGHEVFLHAAQLALQKRGDLRFACIGDDPLGLRAGLQGLAVRLDLGGRLQWSEGRNDMPRVYSALDVLCSASVYGEGFSNAVGEAMACEVPCVVTDVGDSARIVGDTGAVVPPGRADALAEAWLAPAPEASPELGRRARIRVQERFSVDRLVASTDRALRNLLS